MLNEYLYEVDSLVFSDKSVPQVPISLDDIRVLIDKTKMN